MAKFEKPKRKTSKEKVAEQQQNELEGLDAQRFKQRLIKVNITTKPYSVLHNTQIFYCGYCGQEIALYSSSSMGTSERIPPLFYACSHRCSRSSYHRAEFIDRLLLELVQKRVTDKFSKPEGKGDFEGLLVKFQEMEAMHNERLKLLMNLHYASYKRDEVLAEIRECKDKIDALQSEVRRLFKTDDKDNPLMYPLFNTNTQDLNKLDLAYRRELVKMLVFRLRFFNEYLIVKMLPITKSEISQGDDFERVFNINLRFSERAWKTELPEPEELEKL